MSMNSDGVYAAIEQIANTPGKNDKQALVSKLLEDELGLRVLTAAYDPFVTYGMAKVPPYAGTDIGRNMLDAEWRMLDAMAKRELTGNAAIENVEHRMRVLTPESAELLRRIITKDLRAGFTDGTINRARPGTLAEFPYMRCSLPKDAKLDTWPWRDGCLSQVKADGMFANVNVYDDGSVSIHSRQGTAFPSGHRNLQGLTDEVSGLTWGFQYHGELLVYKDGEMLPRQISNGMLNKIAQGGVLEGDHVVVFHAWDAIPLSAVVVKGKHETPYVDRFLALGRAVQKVARNYVRLIETRPVKSLAEAYQHSSECLARGLEGTIIKHRRAIWKDGTSKEQVKLKLEVEVDLRIVGFTEGKGKNAGTFGAVTVETSDGLLRVDVGTGITDKGRATINAQRAELLGGLVTVKANDLLKPSTSNPLHSLFLPVWWSCAATRPKRTAWRASSSSSMPRRA
jgi:DNA ligase-1